MDHRFTALHITRIWWFLAPRLWGNGILTTELALLVCAIVLGLIHAIATGQASNMQHGVAYGLSPRDERKPLTGWGGRLDRAFANYLQTFSFFAAAVLMAHVTGRHGWQTVIGAHLYFWARLAYVPLYVAGVPGLRSLAFTAATVGIVLILTAMI